MFSSAVYSFLGFPGWGPVHLVVPHQGSPVGTAARLGRAWRGALEAGSPPTALLSQLLRQEQRADPLSSPQLCRQAEFRYLVVHRQGARWPIRITAWQCCGHPPAWRRCCAPMELQRFIERFDPKRGRAPAQAVSC